MRSNNEAAALQLEQQVNKLQLEKVTPALLVTILVMGQGKTTTLSISLLPPNSPGLRVVGLGGGLIQGPGRGLVRTWARQPLSVSGCNCQDKSLNNEHNARVGSCFDRGVALLAEGLHWQRWKGAIV